MKLILIIWLTIGSMMCYDLFKSTQASEIELTLGGWSAHFGKPPVEEVRYANELGHWRVKQVQNEYNENNKALGVRYDSYEYVTFSNSYFKRSHMLSYHPRYSFSNDVKFGLRLGGATGYDDKTVKVIIQPTATVYYKMIGAEFGWLPSLNSSHPYGIFTLSGKVRF